MHAWILDKKTASTKGLIAFGSIPFYVYVPSVTSLNRSLFSIKFNYKFFNYLKYTMPFINVKPKTKRKK